MLKFCKVKLSWCLSFDFRWKTELAVLDICHSILHVCVFSSDGGGKLLCCKTAPCKHCSEHQLPGQWLQDSPHQDTPQQSCQEKTATGSQCHLVVFWLRNDLITFPEWIYGGLIKAFRPTASRHWSRLLFAKCITLTFAMM